MKQIIEIIFVWFLAVIVLLQLDENRIMKNSIENLEIENYRMGKTVQDLVLTVEEYQNKTERMIDTNIQIITEGGWK